MRHTQAALPQANNSGGHVREHDISSRGRFDLISIGHPLWPNVLQSLWFLQLKVVHPLRKAWVVEVLGHTRKVFVGVGAEVIVEAR